MDKKNKKKGKLNKKEKLNSGQTDIGKHASLQVMIADSSILKTICDKCFQKFVLLGQKRRLLK